MKYSLLFIIVIAIASCNNGSKKPDEIAAADTTIRPVENKIMIPSSSCYSSVTGKDSFFLKVEIFPNVVTGQLSYQFYEKDSNTGDIEGKLSGDTLIAYYTFTSEGKRSVRQVAFLLKDSVVIEGYAEVGEKKGKTIFKKLSEIDFTKGTKFLKVACENR